MVIPYGYGRINGEWVIDEGAGAIVTRIFTEFADPYRHTGLTEVAHGLNLDEIATQRGGKWHASTVAYILQNSCYAGERGFPAIVDRELWERAQQRLAALPHGPTR